MLASAYELNVMWNKKRTTVHISWKICCFSTLICLWPADEQEYLYNDHFLLGNMLLSIKHTDTTKTTNDNNQTEIQILTSSIFSMVFLCSMNEQQALITIHHKILSTNFHDDCQTDETDGTEWKTMKEKNKQGKILNCHTYLNTHE